MTDKPLARPRQVTLVAGLILGGSVLIVLLAFDQVAQNGSIEAREAADRFVSTYPGDALGLSADEWLTVRRVLATVAGACAVACAILGWQVLQRSRSARLALSVVGPVLLVSSLATADFAGALVAAAIVMLWTQPAKDWFAGRAAASTAVAAPWPPPAKLAERPPSSDAVVQPAPLEHPNPYAPQTAQVPPEGIRQRPGAVLVAGLLSIGASIVTLVAMVVALWYAVGSRADFLDFVDEALADADARMPEGVSAADIADVMIGFFIVLTVWCLVAIVLAVLALRGSNAARITLVVSAGGAALVSLVGILAIAPLALTAAAVATMVLLLRGDVNRWYTARRQS